MSRLTDVSDDTFQRDVLEAERPVLVDFTAAQYGILSMPTLVLFSGGVERGRIVGAQPRRKIERQLDEWLGVVPA